MEGIIKLLQQISRSLNTVLESDCVAMAAKDLPERHSVSAYVDLVAECFKLRGSFDACGEDRPKMREKYRPSIDKAEVAKLDSNEK